MKLMTLKKAALGLVLMALALPMVGCSTNPATSDESASQDHSVDYLHHAGRAPASIQR